MIALILSIISSNLLFFTVILFSIFLFFISFVISSKSQKASTLKPCQRPSLILFQISSSSTLTPIIHEPSEKFSRPNLFALSLFTSSTNQLSTTVSPSANSKWSFVQFFCEKFFINLVINLLTASFENVT